MEVEEETIRRKRVGEGGEDLPGLGVLEGEILSYIWDAGEPQSSVQVYETMHFTRRAQKREMASPSTIAVTLSRMVEKGLLTSERRPHGGKSYYGPAKTRAQVVTAILDDVSKRLIGQPLGFLLERIEAEPARGAGLKALSTEEANIEPVAAALRKLQKSDNKPVPVRKVTW